MSESSKVAVDIVGGSCSAQFARPDAASELRADFERGASSKHAHGRVSGGAASSSQHAERVEKKR